MEMLKENLVVNSYKELINKYPKIFRDVGVCPAQSPISFGIECGIGWYDLLDTLCEQIQRYCDQQKDASSAQVVAAQVKEKFGTLRFYTDNNSEYIDGLICMAEHMSRNICERCGEKGKIIPDYWLICLCDSCNMAYRGISESI